MNSFRVPTDDLIHILNQNRGEFEKLRHSNILILGGTGFIGNWITQTLIRANNEYELEAHLVIVSRNVKKVQEMFGTHQVEVLSVGNLVSKSFENLHTKDFSHVIFAATSTSQRSEINESEIMDLLLQVLDLVTATRRKPSFLHLSSGAAGLDLGGGAYGTIKSKIESIVGDFNSRELIAGSNPRIFATYGPGLPLADKYAIGNFMLDGLSGRAVNVKGNASTVRSYIYISDLISLLLGILVQPDISRIDIGGSGAISIQELAETIAAEFEGREVIYENTGQLPSSYIPDARYLSVGSKAIPLIEGVRKWRRWAESTSL